MDKQLFHTELEALQIADNYRTLRNDIDSFAYNLSSNDYLGINSDDALYQEFLKTIQLSKPKFSAASSRLLTGNSQEYIDLEFWLQQSFNKEAALIFNSGYHANCGILPAISTSKDLIIADKLVHASIIDGIKLSNAKLERYKHLDYTHLEKILQQNRSQYTNVYIVTESIFSMDGDIADLNRLVAIKNEYDAFLYVDEAHAFGVRGIQGLGCVEEQNCIDSVDFIVATFGKAIASVGAFVVCDEVFKNYLINKARTLIFSTALPPINLAWTLFICELLPQFRERRERLETLSRDFSKLLGVMYQSHIIPHIIGENSDALRVAKRLQDSGFLVMPVRYPTVAKGTARLRFSLKADLSLHDISGIKSIIS